MPPEFPVGEVGGAGLLLFSTPLEDDPEEDSRVEILTVLAAALVLALAYIGLPVLLCAGLVALNRHARRN